MQRFSHKLFYLIIIILINSCKSDFNVTAPYKETTVVYGLLNAGVDTQWVRINKAFLGDGNAYVMAQQPDSINYPDILDVKLEDYNDGGSLVKTINLVRDSGIQKEPGIFATTPNILYRTDNNEKISQNDNYKITIYNRESGKTITAKTNVVDSILMTYPLSTYQVNWYNQASPFLVKWRSVPEGFAYQLTVRFHYGEVNLSNPSDSVPKYIDWVLPQEPFTYSASQTQYIAHEFGRYDFYYFVKGAVTPNTAVKRVIGHIDFIFTVAASEFYTYIQVNHPPTGVNQSIPQYTNVDGGIGIFSSRLTQGYKNFSMDQDAKEFLINGNITGNLQFVQF